MFLAELSDNGASFSGMTRAFPVRRPQVLRSAPLRTVYRQNRTAGPPSNPLQCKAGGQDFLRAVAGKAGSLYTSH